MVLEENFIEAFYEKLYFKKMNSNIILKLLNNKNKKTRMLCLKPFVSNHCQILKFPRHPRDHNVFTKKYRTFSGQAKQNKSTGFSALYNGSAVCLSVFDSLSGCQQPNRAALRAGMFVLTMF